MLDAELDNSIPSVTPVQRVIRAFGAAGATALAGLTTDAIRKWGRPISKGGQGGLVPARYQKRYLREAEQKGLALSADDLIAEPVE